MCPLFEGRKEIFNMKGYYSLGLAGYEVDIIDKDHIRWLFVGTDREQIAHRARIYYTTGGRPYFNANGRRIHLDQCLRADI